jgi:hypothetical protein
MAVTPTTEANSIPITGVVIRYIAYTAFEGRFSAADTRRNMPEPLWCSRGSLLIGPIMVAASVAHCYMRPMQSGSVALSCTQSWMIPMRFTLRSDLSRRRLNR